MDIIFKEKYVNYDLLCKAVFPNIGLMDINNVLLENNIFLEIGDDFNNDWAGFSYYFCKQYNKLDERTISSFIYVITWFMTSNPIDINPYFKSNVFYKNGEIIKHCLEIYNDIVDDFDSEVELCAKLFIKIYNFYLNHHEEFIKKTERMNCVLSYKEFERFNAVDGNSHSDKLRVLLDNYYSK